MSFQFDLRSDTITKPSRGMRQAIFDAPVGDDVFDEDPTIKVLEQEVATLLGKEAGLFVPSGVMANQIAINLHTRPGDTIICPEGAHVFYHETGAASALSGVQFDCVPTNLGYAWDVIQPRLRTAGPIDASPTTLVVIENTHNRGGGRATPQDIVASIAQGCREHGVKFHCDGARLWNAAVALDTTEKELVAGCDSVAVCFSKGLGAPAGSMLCGTKDFIQQAKRIRKRWGGGMRQVGILGAAALYALRENRLRMHEDHTLAAQIAANLKELSHPRLQVNYPDRGTNMVFVKVTNMPGPELQEKLAKRDIGCFHFGDGWVRLVTHLDCPAGAAEAVTFAIRSLL